MIISVRHAADRLARPIVEIRVGIQDVGGPTHQLLVRQIVERRPHGLQVVPGGQVAGLRGEVQEATEERAADRGSEIGTVLDGVGDAAQEVGDPHPVAKRFPERGNGQRERPGDMREDLPAESERRR